MSDGLTLSSPTGNAAGIPQSAVTVVESAGLRLKEMGQLDGGFEYPAVNAANARFEKRLKIDREFQQKIKKVAKELNIEM